MKSVHTIVTNKGNLNKSYNSSFKPIPIPHFPCLIFLFYSQYVPGTHTCAVSHVVGEIPKTID